MATFCNKCGKPLKDQETKCSFCGTNVNAPTETRTPSSQPIVVNVENTNINSNGGGGRKKSKWVALLFCIFLGVVGGHKFYEGKTGMGILYLFTCGLLGIGVCIDFWILLFKHNPYYV